MNKAARKAYPYIMAPDHEPYSDQSDGAGGPCLLEDMRRASAVLDWHVDKALQQSGIRLLELERLEECAQFGFITHTPEDETLTGLILAGYLVIGNSAHLTLSFTGEMALRAGVLDRAAAEAAIDDTIAPEPSLLSCCEKLLLTVDALSAVSFSVLPPTESSILLVEPLDDLESGISPTAEVGSDPPAPMP